MDLARCLIEAPRLDDRNEIFVKFQIQVNSPYSIDKKNLCEYAIPLIRKNNEHRTIEMLNYAESL